MLQKPFVEFIGRHMPGRIQPRTIGRDVISCIEPQAAEHMRGDLAALLRRGREQRVQTTKLRRQALERLKLPGHPRHAPIRAIGGRIGIDRLPHQRRPIFPIRHHQPVQERGAAARQASDEDRPLDALLADRRRATLGLAQVQQIGQESDRVPPQREAADHAQRRFFDATVQQDLQWLQKRPCRRSRHDPRHADAGCNKSSERSCRRNRPRRSAIASTRESAAV